jgi:methylmalonyl-CoA mutase cobalamin-binding domain/chain
MGTIGAPRWSLAPCATQASRSSTQDCAARPEDVVQIAIQEDADIIAISILSGAHMTLIPKVLEILRQRNAEDILVIAGGTIPDDDAEALKRDGRQRRLPARHAYRGVRR